MESEVQSFLDSLGSNLRKPDVEALAQRLVSALPEWINILKNQLSSEFWNEAPLERQLSILYVLNAYFKDAHKNRLDLIDWVDTIAKMLINLRIGSAQNEKEVKHVIKLVNIWGTKEKEVKLKGQWPVKRRVSIFPKEQCDEWLSAIARKAALANINLLPMGTTNDGDGVNGGQLSVLQPGVEVEMATVADQQSAMQQALYSAASADNAANPTQSQQPQSSAGITINARVYSVKATILPPLASAVVPPSTTSEPWDNVVAEMENGLVKAVCKFQMQVFQSFACHATRRLDRWNMNIVMMSAYYLLHLYIKENGVLDVSAAPLVVACIYLSGKAEYLFVKADKLRQVANKFVRSINEPVMSNNLQVYKYEAELLRLLQYDVGTISNPLRILKALDIRGAHRQGASALDPIVHLSQIGSIGAIIGTSATAQATKASGGSHDTSPRNSTAPTVTEDALNPPPNGDKPSIKPPAGAGLSQSRRLLDDAVALFVSEDYLYGEDLILIDWDYYLAATVLLEKTQRALRHDPKECERQITETLLDLSHLSPILKKRCVLTVADQNGAPSAFMKFMSSLRGQAAPSESTSAATAATAVLTRVGGTSLFSVSDRTIELTLPLLSAVERTLRAETTVQKVALSQHKPTNEAQSMALSGKDPNFAAASHNTTDRDLTLSSRTAAATAASLRLEQRADATQDRRKRGLSRSPCHDRSKAVKKQRWDTYGEPDRRDDRDSRVNIEDREDRESRARVGRGSSRDRRDKRREPNKANSRERAREKEKGRGRPPASSIYGPSYDDPGRHLREPSRGGSPVRGRKDEYRYSRSRSRSRSRGWEYPRSQEKNHPFNADMRDMRHTHDTHAPAEEWSGRSTRDRSPPRWDSHGRENSRERRIEHHRGRSPPRDVYSLPPAPPLPPPPPPLSPPPPLPRPQSRWARPRSPSPELYKYGPSSVPSILSVPKSTIVYSSSPGEYRTVPPSSRKAAGVMFRTDRPVEEDRSSDSNYCQFVGTSAPSSSVPTPFMVAPPPPRVMPSQSTTQLWMPASDDSPVVIQPNPNSFVDLTKTPKSNTGSSPVSNLKARPEPSGEPPPRSNVKAKLPAKAPAEEELEEGEIMEDGEIEEDHNVEDNRNEARTGHEGAEEGVVPEYTTGKSLYSSLSTSRKGPVRSPQLTSPAKSVNFTQPVNSKSVSSPVFTITFTSPHTATAAATTTAASAVAAVVMNAPISEAVAPAVARLSPSIVEVSFIDKTDIVTTEGATADQLPTMVTVAPAAESSLSPTRSRMDVSDTTAMDVSVAVTDVTLVVSPPSPPATSSTGVEVSDTIASEVATADQSSPTVTAVIAAAPTPPATSSVLATLAAATPPTAFTAAAASAPPTPSTSPTHPTSSTTTIIDITTIVASAEAPVINTSDVAVATEISIPAPIEPSDSVADYTADSVSSSEVPIGQLAVENSESLPTSTTPLCTSTEISATVESVGNKEIPVKVEVESTNPVQGGMGGEMAERPTSPALEVTDNIISEPDKPTNPSAGEPAVAASASLDVSSDNQVIAASQPFPAPLSTADPSSTGQTKKMAIISQPAPTPVPTVPMPRIAVIPPMVNKAKTGGSAVVSTVNPAAADSTADTSLTHARKDRHDKRHRHSKSPQPATNTGNVSTEQGYSATDESTSQNSSVEEGKRRGSIKSAPNLPLHFPSQVVRFSSRTSPRSSGKSELERVTSDRDRRNAARHEPPPPPSSLVVPTGNNANGGSPRARRGIGFNTAMLADLLRNTAPTARK